VPGTHRLRLGTDGRYTVFHAVLPVPPRASVCRAPGAVMETKALADAGGRWGMRRALALALGVLLGVAPASAWSDELSCKDRQNGGAHAVDFVAAVARQSPAVVLVTVSGQGRKAWQASTMQMPWPYLPESGRSSASGFIIDREGHILTSAHVVEAALEVAVVLAGERRVAARIVGLDRRTDVALLKIPATEAPVATLGAGSRLCPGQWVAAVGAPFGFDHSVTAGVVSAHPRFLPGGAGVPLIQTDVALNPGNSGGPLLNELGEVVGMNSMIYSENGRYQGVSFSLPIEVALRVASELRSRGRITRGQIGARTQPLTPELAAAFGLQHAGAGALVTRVQADGQAAAAGLRSGDVVLAVNASAAMGYAQIQEAVAAARPGTAITLDVWRRRAHVALTVPVSESPPDVPPSGDTAGGSRQELRFGLELMERTGRQGGGGMEPGLYVGAASGSAQRAGLRFGDMVLAINDLEVRTLAEFDKAITMVAGSEPVALLVRRGSITNFVAVGP
jgi:serine protease Do